MRRSLLTFCLLGLVFTAYGQRMSFFHNIKYEDRTRTSRDFYSVYLLYGPSTYHGEMVDITSLFASGRFGINTDLEESGYLRFSGGFNYRLRSFHPLTIRTEFSFYTIKGDDLLSEDSWKENKRQLSFVARNWEGWIGPQIDILQYGGRAGPGNQQYRITGYVYTGIGFTTVMPKAELNGQMYNLRPLQTEGVEYSPIALTWPIGLGVKARFSKEVTVGLDVGYRLTSTDYLDDVSGFYADSASFSNPIAQQLADPTGRYAGGEGRGNPTANDGYIFTSLTVQYNLPNGIFNPRSITGPGSYRGGRTNNFNLKDIFQNNNRPNNPRRRNSFNRAGRGGNNGGFSAWLRRIFNQ